MELEVLPPIRLVQALKLSGIFESGADASAAISAGEVSVDGEVCTQRARSLEIGTRIKIASEFAGSHSLVLVTRS